MAQLDIQKKRGVNPIWWIIGLIIIVAIIWWLVVANRHNNVAQTEPVAAAVATAMAPADSTTNTAGPITDMTMLMGASPQSDMVGRPVQFTGAKVQSVVSDKGFWVGPSSSERLYVIRTEQSSPATPPNGAVNAGQTVSIYGTVQRMPAVLTQSATPWNLNSTDSSALAAHGVYVAADSVHIQ